MGAYSEFSSIDILSFGRRSSTAQSAPTWRSLRHLRSSVSGRTAERTPSMASDSPRSSSCTRCERQDNNVFFKGVLFMPIFTIRNISLRCLQNVSEKFQLKISHRSFIISFWKCLFWVKAETHCFRACLFKCKWAAAPHPFSRIGPCLYSSYLGYSAKKHLFLFWLSCLSLKSCILNHISLNLWYTVFWVHTSEANAQKAAVTRHVSAKLGSLSCLIAL